MSTLKNRKIIFENFQMLKKTTRYSRTGACNKTITNKELILLTYVISSTFHIFQLSLKQIAIHICWILKKFSGKCCFWYIKTHSLSPFLKLSLVNISLNVKTHYPTMNDSVMTHKLSNFMYYNTVFWISITERCFVLLSYLCTFIYLSILQK